MYTHHTESIVKSIKSQSWAIKQSVGTFRSVRSIIDSVCKPTDWNQVADKCSRNINHEHYGKTVEEILSIWQNKSYAGEKRGKDIEIAIQHIRSGHKVADVDTSEFDKITCNKFESFINFHTTKLLPSVTYVGSELWLNSSRLGIVGRLDELVKLNDSNDLIVFDYKNTETISNENRWKKHLGPLSHIDECELSKYTIQLYLYKYILEEYGFSIYATRIIQLLQNETKSLKMMFDYDKRLIEEIVKFGLTTKVS